MLLISCGNDAGGGARPDSQAPPVSATTRPSATDGQPSAGGRPPSQPTTPGPAPVVVLDPGHNGGNADAGAAINREVPAGRDRTKPCNTTGTATDAGYPEHSFTFDVARRVSQALSARGVQVRSTRADDAGVGPCVDQRAAMGNNVSAWAVVSIHADGASSTSAHGFHVAYSDPPLNAAQGEPALTLATALRDRMGSAGFAPATYVGRDGLSGRDDLAGLNLSERPAALVECGNMRNEQEAALMTAPQGRQRYADAIAGGIASYVHR